MMRRLEAAAKLDPTMWQAWALLGQVRVNSGGKAGRFEALPLAPARYKPGIQRVTEQLGG